MCRAFLQFQANYFHNWKKFHKNEDFFSKIRLGGIYRSCIEKKSLFEGIPSVTTWTLLWHSSSIFLLPSPARVTRCQVVHPEDELNDFYYALGSKLEPAKPWLAGQSITLEPSRCWTLRSEAKAPALLTQTAGKWWCQVTAPTFITFCYRGQLSDLCETGSKRNSSHTFAIHKMDSKGVSTSPPQHSY